MGTSNKTQQPGNAPTALPNANLKAPTPAQTQSQIQQQGPEHSVFTFFECFLLKIFVDLCRRIKSIC